MIVIVQDANILIDLEKASLLRLYFALDGLENHTTDLVLSELPDVISEIVSLSRVEVHDFAPQQMFALVAFKANQPSGLSMADCSVLQLALANRAVLLTGDGKLRSCAKGAGIKVHGTLWVLDRIVDARLITQSAMASVLERLMQDNPRLPMDECQIRVAAWRKAAA